MKGNNRLRRLGAIILITFSVWIALMGAIVPYKPSKAALNEQVIVKLVNHQNQKAEKVLLEKRIREELAALKEKRAQRDELRETRERKHWLKERKESEDSWKDFLEKQKMLAAVKSMLSGGTKGEYQKYAYSLFEDYGWSTYDFQCLIWLWERESNWNPNAHNGSSGAHGIPQSLPAGKMASEGADYYTNGETQIRWGLKYIAGRYGSPAAAWNHSEWYGWY